MGKNLSDWDLKLLSQSLAKLCGVYLDTVLARAAELHASSDPTGFPVCLLALHLLLGVGQERQNAAPQPCPGVSVPERVAGDLLALLSPYKIILQHFIGAHSRLLLKGTAAVGVNEQLKVVQV